MDIDKDLADPDHMLRRYHDGAYLYRSENSNDFDIDRFDRHYEQYREKRKKMMHRQLGEKLDEINLHGDHIPIHKEPLGQILIKTKDAIFNTLDDLLQHKFTISTLTKNNRLFYLGILFIAVALLLYLFHMFTHKEISHRENNKSVIQIVLPEKFMKQ
uniref:Uncharacterized protein n=1 Tax=Mimivirus LCMiAC01 TaxID=2506608 RepID=A0A481YYZ4_9VIRU|nr:MAG: hypothetical protein LCMiAC01_01590 [Mimivirus LCMiAC01]